MSDLTGTRVYNREWQYTGTVVQRIGATRWLVEADNGVQVEAEERDLAPDETLPDAHTRTLVLSLSVVEFRELMRAAAYRAADLGAGDHVAQTLEAVVTRVGDAWEQADPGESADRRVIDKALRHALKDGDTEAVAKLRARLETEGSDVGHLLKMRKAGAFVTPCAECGDPDHCKAECPELGLGSE